MIQLRLNPGILIWFLLALVGIEISFLVCDLVINHGEWIRYAPVQNFFNIAREDGAASWFQVSQTLLVALTLWLLCALSFAAKKASSVKWGWLFFALFYSFMAFDDGAQFHERAGTVAEIRAEEAAARAAAGQEPAVSGFPTYFWHLVMGPFFAAAGLFLLWFAFREMRKDRTAFILFLIAMVSMGAAEALDFFEGMSPVDPANLLVYVRKWTGYSQTDVEHFSRAVEETIEMISMSYFWIAYLMVLVREFPEFSVSFQAGRSHET